MSFNGIANLRDANESVKIEKWQLLELKKCALDPVYFIRNYVYINTKDHGMQLMKTYPFQDEAVKRFLKYRFNINRWSRQVGKSTVVRAFILWYSLFNKDKVVAMLGNKLKLAKEQLQLLRDSYLMLPYWMQPGVKLWNKTEVQFSNNTRIIVAATSPDGIRGFSINLLYLDEFAFLRQGLADDFIASVFPTISSGKTTRVIITSTPFGLNFFYRMWQEAVDEKTATPEDLQTKYVKSTVMWDEVPGRTVEWGLAEKARIGEQRFRQEYECKFIGSAITLIDYTILQSLEAKVPFIPKNVDPNYSLRIYAPPLKLVGPRADWTYVACIDPGYGIRQDNHVLQIVLAKSSIDAEQVCTMSSNNVPIEDFCAASAQILSKYGNPPLIIEYNGPGARAYSCMFNEQQYDNLENFDNYLRGLWATNNIKQTAVMLLKLYVQRKYIKLTDDMTIKELMSFTRLTVNKWGAGGGNHDDHVTSLYWIIYYMACPRFCGHQVELKFIDGVEVGVGSSEMLQGMQDAIAYMQDGDAQAEELAVSKVIASGRI